jgi:hypothetical protein
VINLLRQSELSIQSRSLILHRCSLFISSLDGSDGSSVVSLLQI